MDHCHNLFFFILEIARNLVEIYEDLFFWKMPEISRKIAIYLGEDLFFGKNLRAVSLVLGLEHSCPWLRKGLSSESQSLTLAPDYFVFLVLGLEHSCPWLRKGLSSESQSLTPDFFCVLGLSHEPCVLDSTSAEKYHSIEEHFYQNRVRSFLILY